MVVLALCMLLTGSINTIATKYQVGDEGTVGVIGHRRPAFSVMGRTFGVIKALGCADEHGLSDHDSVAEHLLCPAAEPIAGHHCHWLWT